jgi:hypothetical protein
MFCTRQLRSEGNCRRSGAEMEKPPTANFHCISIHLRVAVKAPIVQLQDHTEISGATQHARRDKWGWRRRVSIVAIRLVNVTSRGIVAMAAGSEAPSSNGPTNRAKSANFLS